MHTCTHASTHAKTHAHSYTLMHTCTHTCTHTYYMQDTVGLISSVRRALASKLRGLGFKSQPGTVGGPLTIIMWGARPGWKLAFS